MSAAAPWWLTIVLAGGIALAAWRAGSLRVDGALAAFLMGALSLSWRYSWGTFLVVWFVLASALSRVGRARKAARTLGIVEKSDQRDAWQVLANGGAFLACALIAPLVGDTQLVALACAAAGSLAAAGADTWSTEIGTLVGGEPWSLRERGRVPSGTSGAITLPGTLGGVAGAIVLAALAVLCQMVPASAAPAIAIGGVVGSWADTVIGAYWQERRWCPTCSQFTERAVHDCGTATEQRGGSHRLNNDAVNALCALAGAAVAFALVVFGIGTR